VTIITVGSAIAPFFWRIWPYVKQFCFFNSGFVTFNVFIALFFYQSSALIDFFDHLLHELTLLRDKASVMRDKTFNLRSGRLTIVHYHIFFWLVFIIYEVTLAAAIRERFNHIADYAAHYLLNILLFYIHCYYVLGTRQLNRLKDYRRALLYLFLEISCYYLFSIWINKLLLLTGIPVNVPDSTSKLFQLSVIYRCLYMIGLSTAFRIALNFITNRERLHEYVTQNLLAEKEKATLRTELVSAELSSLRSQINPHFLFNTLNSVYNRIRKNDPNSAEYVMVLADLMRYALQPQTATDEVFVQSELEHITNYMKLQQMRYSTEIDFKVSTDDKELKIVPLLLITLIENLFQHGNLHHSKHRPVIEIQVSNGGLLLTTRNYIRHDSRPGNGVGLDNVRKRLEVYYADRHALEIDAVDNVFSLKLHIKLR
jgi:sensor histidine kinase YesM